MKLFPLVFLIHHQSKPLLRPEYEWLGVAVALATLGMGFPLAFLFAFVLARLLGIAAELPINSQFHATLWMVLGAAGLIFFVLVGYLASFALLGVVLRMGYGWTWARVGELLFESRLPSHWAADPVNLAANGGPGDAVARARFIAQTGVFGRKLRIWSCFVATAAVCCQIARFACRRGGWMDAHGSQGALLLTAFVCFVSIFLWLVHIVRRYAPRCLQCRRSLAGRQAVQALASNRCPSCGQPVFGEAPVSARCVAGRSAPPL